jgi:hypothetical protein
VSRLDPRDLERRLTAVERALASRAVPEQHIAVTADNGSTTVMQSLHSGANEFRIVLAPLPLSGRLQVKRMWSVVDSSTGLGNAADFATALYRFAPRAYDRSSPIDVLGRPLTFELLKVLGTFTHLGGTETRYNVTLGSELVLDPRRGHYFIGFQGNQYARWHSPQASQSTVSRPTCIPSQFVGTAVGEFPTTIREQPSTTAFATPLFVLYSALGVRLYGNREVD